jgi:AbrB family looped-hinge helix DNA binding protein
MKTPTTQERTGRVGQRRQVVIPREILETLNLQAGDVVAFAEQKNRVLITPRRVAGVAGTMTVAERRAVDRGIAASENDYKEGHSHGPFKTHEEFIASLHEEAAKLRGKKNKRAVR